MASKDLHEKPFDETTIRKLQIFEDYAQAWIPTFVMRGDRVICVFDFFGGTGYDKDGVKGSPIRILEMVKQQVGNIFQKKVKIQVYINEWEPKKTQEKFQLLKESCNKYLAINPDVKRAIDLFLYNEDFEQLFPKLLPTIKQFPSLVYLDQNGIKFLSEKYFLELEKTSETDFLYFVSSSYFWRFGEKNEFKVNLDIDMVETKKDPYKFIHKNIIEQLRKKLPANTKLKLYPFSLKKGTNIYGIVFGASHASAVEKFLTIAWKKNEQNGEADFDINDERTKIQLPLFGDQKLSKIGEFKKMLRDKVLKKEITDNFQALDFTYKQGHIGTHAAECLREMKKKGEVKYEGSSPLITYENVHNSKKKINYLKITNHGTIIN